MPAAPAHFAKAAASIQSQTTSGPSSISQEAGLAALALGKAGGEPVVGSSGRPSPLPFTRFIDSRSTRGGDSTEVHVTRGGL